MVLQNIIARFSRPSVTCEKRDLEALHKACEILRHGFRQRVRRFCMLHQDRTLVFQYGSDCTPLLTKERFREVVGELDVSRAGHAGHEFLIQRLFVEAGPGNRIVAVEVPIPMRVKTAYAHFAAARAFSKTPRELGHRGLCVVFHKYDRALQSALDRLHRQYQAAWDDKQAEDQTAGRFYREWATSWWLSVGCFAHDVHGGLRWSVLAYTRGKELMRSMFLVHESLRHAYSLLCKHAAAWARSTLVFEDLRHVGIRSFYTALGVEESWIEVYTDLQIRFEGGRLLVAESYKHRDNVIHLVVAVLLKNVGISPLCRRSVCVDRCFQSKSRLEYRLGPAQFDRLHRHAR